MKKKSRKSNFAYVAKISKNLGTADDPDWINYRIGAGFTTQGQDYIDIVLNLDGPWLPDGTKRIRLWPHDPDHDGKPKKRK
jgi:hypothetical protein